MASKKKNTAEKTAPVAQSVPQAQSSNHAHSDSIPEQAQPLKDFFETNPKQAWLVAFGLLFVGIFIAFKGFILGEKTYFFKDIGSDSINFSYPVMYHIASYMAKYGVPKWSFNMGMGQSIFPFMLRDPFDIFYFLAGKDSITYGIIYKEVIKILLGGMTFFFYLRKVGISAFSSVAGSLMFAFSGFVILGSGWYYFTFEAFNLALFLLATEQLLKDKTWFLFPIAVALTCISQPFNLYLFGLFLIVYTLLRLYQTDKLNVKDSGMLFLKMAGLGVVGMLVAGPFFVENVVQLFESPRGGGAFSLATTLKSQPMFEPASAAELGTGILRFFSTDILGGGMDFRGWKNLLEAPMSYCGLPALLLMPQVFGFLSKKMKIGFGIFLAFWLIPMIFPYFRHAFWLFSGDYYRIFSFFISLVFIYYSLTALDLIIQHRKVNMITLIATTVLLLVLLNYPYFEDKGMVNSAISAFAAIFIIGYAAVLFMIGKTGKPGFKYGFLAMLFIEVLFMTNSLMNDREPMTPEDLEGRHSYNDYTNEAVAFINAHDKSFFRIDKAYRSSPAIHYSINDAMAQDYRGTSAYNSFNQEYYIKYLTLLGLCDPNDETSSRWAQGFLRRIIPEAESSVKYILTHSIDFPLWRAICDSVTRKGDVIVLKSKFALPFGFTYNSYIKESTYATLSGNQKDFVSLDAVVIKDEDVTGCKNLKEFNLADTTNVALFSPEFYAGKIAKLKQDTLNLQEFSNTHLKGVANMTEEKVMFFSLPYDGGWTTYVDGKEAKRMILSAGMTGLLLSRGQHNIEFKYELRYYQKGIYMSLAGLAIFAALFFVFRRNPKVEAA